MIICLFLEFSHIPKDIMKLVSSLTPILLIIISILALSTSLGSFRKQVNNKDLAEQINKQRMSYMALTRYTILTDGIVIEDPRFISAIEDCGNHPVFVVRHSLLDCSSCQNDIIDLISKHIKIKDNPNVLFIACGYKDKAVSYGRTVYLEDTLGWGGLFDMPNYPFVFIYDGCVFHSFLPDPILGNIFDDYLDAISEKYDINSTTNEIF